MPPMSMVLEHARDVFAPALLPALAVALLGLLVPRRARAAVLPRLAGLALVVGVFAGNAYAQTLNPSFMGAPLDRLFPAVALAVLASMALPAAGAEVARRVLWAVLGAAAGWWLTPPAWREAYPVSILGLAAVVGLTGWAGERATRALPGSTVPMTLALASACLAGVLIHAHSNRLMDAADLLYGAGLGASILALARRCPAGPAVAGLAVALPALAVTGWRQTESLVPGWAFALSGSAGLGLLVTLVPAWGRLSRRAKPLALAVAVALPALVALGAAAWLEDLPVPDESEW